MARNLLKTITIVMVSLLLTGQGWAAIWSSDDGQVPPDPFFRPAQAAEPQESATTSEPIVPTTSGELAPPAALPLPMTGAETPAAVTSTMVEEAQASVPSPVVPAAAAPSDSETDYDFGDFSSQVLTVQAWESLILEDYIGAEVYAKKCIELHEAKAKEQQASLTDFASADTALQYWALNDVATCYFIWAKALNYQKQTDAAREKLRHITKHLGFAQAWDSRGWFWRVAEAAKDQMETVGTPYDFGDYTSQTLATKGWQALGEKDYKGVELYAKKCIQLYEAEALKQQASMTEFAPKEKAFEPWALNDVAVSYFLLGEAYSAQNKYREARASYQKVADQFGFAQAWDPKGWFWKVAVASKVRLRKVNAQEKRGW